MVVRWMAGRVGIGKICSRIRVRKYKSNGLSTPLYTVTTIHLYHLCFARRVAHLWWWLYFHIGRLMLWVSTTCFDVESHRSANPSILLRKRKFCLAPHYSTSTGAYKIDEINQTLRTTYLLKCIISSHALRFLLHSLLFAFSVGNVFDFPFFFAATLFSSQIGLFIVHFVF